MYICIIISQVKIFIYIFIIELRDLSKENIYEKNNIKFAFAYTEQYF